MHLAQPPAAAAERAERGVGRVRRLRRRHRDVAYAALCHQPVPAGRAPTQLPKSVEGAGFSAIQEGWWSTAWFRGRKVPESARDVNQTVVFDRQGSDCDCQDTKETVTAVQVQKRGKKRGAAGQAFSANGSLIVKIR